MNLPASPTKDEAGENANQSQLEADLNSERQKMDDSTKENYEMFMLQRVKALQQVNPALKALMDLQGMTIFLLIKEAIFLNLTKFFSHNSRPKPLDEKSSFASKFAQCPESTRWSVT